MNVAHSLDHRHLKTEMRLYPLFSGDRLNRNFILASRLKQTVKEVVPSTERLSDDCRKLLHLVLIVIVIADKRTREDLI
jgi:hypothetical protein